MNSRPPRSRGVKAFLLETDAWWTYAIQARSAENVHSFFKPIYRAAGIENKLDDLNKRARKGIYEKFVENIERSRR